MYFTCRSFYVASGVTEAQRRESHEAPPARRGTTKARWIAHPIVVGRQGKSTALGFFIALPAAAQPGNDAPTPAEPGPAPSHMKPGPPEGAPACDTDPRGRSARGNNSGAPFAPASHRSDEDLAPDL